MGYSWIYNDSTGRYIWAMMGAHYAAGLEKNMERQKF